MTEPDTRRPIGDLDQPASMEEADAANGEAPTKPVRRTTDHPTGERQAAENREDESPA